MKVEILGTGCHDCLKLELLVAELVGELGLEGVDVERVDEERAIRRYMPIEEVPGLAIDGRLVSVATVPDPKTIRRWLTEAEPAGQVDRS